MALTTDNLSEDAFWGLASALAAAAVPTEVAAAVAVYGAAAVGASFANVALLDSDRGLVRAVHDPHLDAGVAARWAEFDLQARTPLNDAMRSGAPVLLGSLDAVAQRYPDMIDDTVAAALVATASIPLRASDGAVLGAVGFGWAVPRSFEADETRRLDLIAGMIAQALDRAVLFQDARMRTEQLGVLQQLTESLAGAVTAEEVARVLAEQVAPLLRAAVLSLGRVTNGVVERLYATLPLLERYNLQPLDARMPVPDAIRAGDIIVLASQEERVAAYPGADWVEPLARFGPMVTLPARLQGRTIGALWVIFPAGRTLVAEDLAVLRILARQCALALERARLLEAERQAAGRERRNAERLRALQTVTARLAGATTSEEIAGIVVGQGVDLIADGGVLAVTDPESGGLRTWPSRQLPENMAARHLTIPLDSDLPAAVCARTGEVLVYQTRAEAIASSPANAEMYTATGISSLLMVPFRSTGQSIGALGVGFFSEQAIDETVIALTAALADLAGQALHRAALTDQNRRVAETLQRSLLPRLPVIDGLEVAARYSPGSIGIEVGGDWYDVIDLGDGRAGLVIGDVMGRGVIAAAVMGQLRAAVRAYTKLELSPGEVLTQLDGLVAHLGEGSFVTCLYAIFDPGNGRLVVANAGHFPPLAVDCQGRAATLLDIPPGPPLGAGDPVFPDHTVDLEAGTLLALFTDGLVESREHDLDHGISALLEHLSEHVGEPLASLADSVLARMGTHHHHDDDTAVLLVRPQP